MRCVCTLTSCVFVFGARVGSFFNVCMHRMPREESVVSPPSHCPHCERANPLVGTTFRWSVFWCFGGRCRYCWASISPRYFLVELLTAVLFLLVWLKYDGPNACGAVYWLLLGGLIAATFIDFEHYIIPNEITSGGRCGRICCLIALPSRLQHAASVGMRPCSPSGGHCLGGLIMFSHR